MRLAPPMPSRRRKNRVSRLSDVVAIGRDAASDLAHEAAPYVERGTEAVTEAVGDAAGELATRALGRRRRNRSSFTTALMAFVFMAFVGAVLYYLWQRRDTEPARLVPQPDEPDTTPAPSAPEPARDWSPQPEPVAPTGSSDDDQHNGHGDGGESPEVEPEQAPERFAPSREPSVPGSRPWSANATGDRRPPAPNLPAPRTAVPDRGFALPSRSDFRLPR